MQDYIIALLDFLENKDFSELWDKINYSFL